MKIALLLAIIVCSQPHKNIWVTMQLVSAQNNDNDISHIIRKLEPRMQNGVIKGVSIEVQTEVKESLLTLAQESSKAREKVIHELIAILEDMSIHKKSQDTPQRGFVSQIC